MFIIIVPSYILARNKGLHNIADHRTIASRKYLRLVEKKHDKN